MTTRKTEEGSVVQTGHSRLARCCALCVARRRRRVTKARSVDAGRDREWAGGENAGQCHRAAMGPDATQSRALPTVTS